MYLKCWWLNHHISTRNRHSSCVSTTILSIKHGILGLFWPYKLLSLGIAQSSSNTETAFPISESFLHYIPYHSANGNGKKYHNVNAIISRFHIQLSLSDIFRNTVSCEKKAVDCVIWLYLNVYGFYLQQPQFLMTETGVLYTLDFWHLVLMRRYA